MLNIVHGLFFLLERSRMVLKKETNLEIKSLKVIVEHLLVTPSEQPPNPIAKPSPIGQWKETHKNHKKRKEEEREHKALNHPQAKRLPEGPLH